jgi:hypothetical protein
LKVFDGAIFSCRFRNAKLESVWREKGGIDQKNTEPIVFYNFFKKSVDGHGGGL